MAPHSQPVRSDNKEHYLAQAESLDVSQLQQKWYSDGTQCHGLGIVDNNELNSYLDYCSHQREYRIWREKKKRNLSTGKKGFLSMTSVTALSAFFLCLLAWWRFVDTGH
ncbi:uncharacterized protein ASPGLDRAFT_44722 [Aspergillus glaucus CBS 516.65]|uniref:Uncharacterized protein n=1 Tax=Aspergillus glaucus CBS 516.65 TaxID=1160497 RepID=A0A1L9VSF6_ASPGL|nr:hypothetical protein ASPGLDRAFT_44722 [Aspergillus glaucus CBS 516.65]OJJ86839.1 hypothetical protein ASPGLDRAFT_44722 [Aspergillus glaucus CBS 516.65]